MPNRIIKESICTSDSISQLSWFEEVLFYRLIVSCDDYGRYDARPAIIKGKLFPLSDITTKQIEKAIIRLSTVAMVKLYEVYGRPFLQLCAWADHQTIRAKKSKFPGPEESASRESKVSQMSTGQAKTENLQADESICMQMQTNESKCSRNPIQSYSKSNSKYMHGADGSAPCRPPLMALPLNDGTEYAVTEEMAETYRALYPAVDIEQALRDMAGWCLANPTKRKTKTGINRFINGWLAREQNKGGTKKENKPQGGRWDGAVI